MYNRHMPPLLEAKGLTKRYGSTVALDSVDFQINEGVTGLLGPNGAGKSTAIKLFLGLIAPTAGSAEVLGGTTYDSPDSRAQLGYMPEHECLPSTVTASEFLMYMAQVSGIPPSQARTRAADVLRHVGLDEERYRSIGEYSTGMKQRVKLAQAIVHDPVLVFLDEPTAGLDPDGRQEMLSLVERTAKTFGISVVLSTHLMGDVERTADSIIVLESGVVAQSGEVAKLTEETETLHVEVADRRDEFAAALAARGVQAESRGDLFIIQKAREADYDHVRDAAVDTGARLKRLSLGASQPGRHLQGKAAVVAREAEVFDLGYQHYTGPREGRSRARVALFVNGIRTLLGIGRGGRSKILPALLFFSAMAPAVVFVIILVVTEQVGRGGRGGRLHPRSRRLLLHCGTGSHHLRRHHGAGASGTGPARERPPALPGAPPYCHRLHRGALPGLLRGCPHPGLCRAGLASAGSHPHHRQSRGLCA